MVFPELRSWGPARWSSSTERAATGGDESRGGAQSLLRCCPAPRDAGTTAYVSVPPTLQSPASVPHWLNRARSRGTLQTEFCGGTPLTLETRAEGGSESKQADDWCVPLIPVQLQLIIKLFQNFVIPSGKWFYRLHFRKCLLLLQD